MRKLLSLFIVAPFVLVIGCRATAPHSNANPATEVANSIWAVDLVRTLPGAQATYLRSIESNWAQGRRIARGRGVVLAYRAYAARPDSARGWDVLLMTEYADSASYLKREEIFAAIFASPEYVRVNFDRPSAEMRSFFVTDVAMRAFVSQPTR